VVAAFKPTIHQKGVEHVKYIGVDVGKNRCQACIMDMHGGIIDEFRFTNNGEGIKGLLDRAGDGECKGVVESTGNLWLRIYETLEENGVEVKLANPAKTKAIASARIKTDKLSARILAHLLRADLIAECYVAPREVRRVRALLRQRASLVKMRTMVKNRVHSHLDRYDYRSPWSDAFGVGGMEWLRGLKLDPVDRCILDSHLRHLKYLDGEIGFLESRIAGHAVDNEDVLLLMTLTGIDYQSAMLLACEIGDIRRFPSAKHFVSWLGLCPGLYQSGDTLVLGRMKKDSNGRARWVLVQAAWVAARNDPRMRELYLRVKARKGSSKAAVRVANKMAVIIWHMLTKREPYEQVKEGLYKSKLKKMREIAV
jgi:transposase